MGKLCRIKCKNREEWLSKRSIGIGASESSALVGLSPFTTTQELWELKTGKRQPEDLSDNPFVQQGVRLEPALRNLYKAIHPELKVTHHPFDMLYQEERPFMYATLDGEIKDGKRKAILEIKTATPQGKAGWSKWDEQIPPNYFTQIVWQIACSGYDFAVLFACLFNRENDFVVREYRFEREDLKEDMAYMIEKATEFWDSVQNQSLPPMTLIL